MKETATIPGNVRPGALNWAGLVAAVLVFALWIASSCFEASCATTYPVTRYPHRYLHVGFGHIAIGENRVEGHGMIVETDFYWTRPYVGRSFWWFDWRFKTTMPFVSMPIWPLALPPLALGLVGWRVRPARRKGGRVCGACGYDLRGLARGAACPECGR